MNYYLAQRLQAMKAVLAPDEEAWLRHIFRWYSRTFHTPLHQVEELPIEDVLQAFYEDRYEDMEEEERKKEIAELLETPAERQERLRAKDEERYEAYEFSRFSEEEERKKVEAKRLADLKPEGAKAMLQHREAPETTLPRSPPPTPMKELKELPPDIEMKFVTDEEFEASLEGQSLPLAKKPQSSQ